MYCAVIYDCDYNLISFRSGFADYKAAREWVSIELASCSSAQLWEILQNGVKK